MLPIVVVAAVRLYRDSLAHMLTHRSEVGVVSTAADIDSAFVQAGRFGPHVALVDMSWDEAIPTVRMLRRKAKGVRVIGLGLSEMPETRAIESIEAGLLGYVGPNASLDELVATICRVARDEMICTPRLTLAIAHRLARLSGEDPIHGAPLTERERQIACLLDEGVSNKAIATELNIEVATVKNHVHNLFAKLGVHRRGEAVAQLRRIGLPAWALREPRSRGA